MRELIGWWWRQMRGMLPDRLLSRGDAVLPDAILAEPADSGGLEPGAVTLWLRQAGVAAEGGVQAPGGPVLPRLLREHPGLPVRLRLPPERLLRRQVWLPLAAEADHLRVLGYEMDRLTPFRPDELFWTARPLRRDREAGRFELLLSLVPRAPLAAALATLRDAGAQPAAIEVPAAGGRPAETIPIDAPGRRPRLASRQHAGQLLAGGLAALVLALVVLAFVRQQAAIDRTAGRIAALQPRLLAVQALRERIRAATAGTDAIDAARAHLGDPLRVMAILTRLLPDDTYLTDLTLRDGVVTITGQSSAAVRLIPRLSGDPTFVAPAFAAPVTRIETTNADLFSIRAGLAQ